MADRPFIFREGRKEVVLPVTPNAYEVTEAINLELINIHEMGDVALAGYDKLISVPPIECMFPANDYDFSNADIDPQEYIEIFKKWRKKKSVVRFIIGGTDINLRVRIEAFSQREKDGTNDVYAKIAISEYRELEAIRFSNTSTAGGGRSAPTEQKTSADYTIKKGDTLSALCQKYYGSAAPDYYNRLAAHNGISNPHMIFTGNSLKIPQPLP